MSSTQQTTRSFYDSHRTVSEMEKGVELEDPKGCAKRYAKRNPHNELVQMWLKSLQKAAESRAAFKQDMDKAITLEKSIMIMEAAWAE